MPFMKGKWPIRRTLKYLREGNLKLKENIDVVTINYNTKQKASKGALDFVFWYVPQLQYKNPDLQIVTFKNLTPSPFFQFFFNNGKKLVVDADSKSKEELHDFIKKAMCRRDETLKKEDEESTQNLPYFGLGFERQCICEIPGQVPCTGSVCLPESARGKYRPNPET